MAHGEQPAAGAAFAFRGLDPGQVLAGRFRVVRPLGRGAMGEVYEAEDLELGERVALKTLRPEIAGDPQSLARFKREIALSQRVTHPNVCRIHDLVRQDGPGGDLVFLTMELLPGETLAERIRRDGPLSTAEARPIVRQLVAGLAAAHAEGIVHRDLKSANVMLVPAPEGIRAVITDFGLARTGEAGAVELTRADVMLGTPAYMAPEQVRGEPATPASDVYALGVVMFEMVTGSLPFVAPTALLTAYRRLEQPPPSPRQRMAGLEAVWERVILRCMALEPAARFARVEEVAAALEPPAPVWRRALPPVAVAVLLALAGALAYATWVTRPARLEAARLYGEGMARFASFDAAAAQELFNRAAELDPKSALVRSALAQAWSRTGHQARAEEEARRALALRPRRGEDRRLIEARYYEVMSDWQAAIERYRALWREEPENLFYGLRLAHLQVTVRAIDDAERTLEELRARAPKDPRVDLTAANVARVRGDFDGQRRAAEQAESKGRALDERRLVALALRHKGFAWLRLGRPDLARAALEESRDLNRELGDAYGAAQALSLLGHMAERRGDLAAALSDFQEALEACRQAGNRPCIAQASNDVGALAQRRGQLAVARQAYEEALVIFREANLKEPELEVQSNLAAVLCEQGELGECGGLLDQLLAGYRGLGDRGGEARTQLALGRLHLERGNVASARAALDQAERLFAELGDASGAALAAQQQGAVELAGDRLPEARRLLEQALARQLELDERPRAGRTRLYLARLALAEGGMDAAAAAAQEAAAVFRAALLPAAEAEA
ncbi:MAG: serine/threonine protein kinase, partial [Acidobacteria bacterium]